MLADRHHRATLAEENRAILRRLEMWDEAVLAHILLQSPAMPDTGGL
jgi:hypothetical protein